MIKNTFERLFLFGLIILFFSACRNQKNFVYFQRTNNASDTVAVSKAYVPKIQPGDILDIYVNSLSPEASSFFNPYTPSTSGTDLSSSSSGSSSSSSSSTNSGNGISTPALSASSAAGFLVDPSGEIQYPLIGNIKVSGYSTTQLRDTLRSILKKYLKEPTVLVRFLNFKISILGEVTKPNVYNIPNEMITLPDALSLAGDLTLFARRDSIEIIRDINGKKVFGYVNLKKRDLFDSPYYYLHANDLVYVQPARSKAEITDRTYILVPSLVSFLSLLVLLIRN